MTILRSPQLLFAARLALAASLLLPLAAPARAQSRGWGWQPGYRSVPSRSQRPTHRSQPRIIYDDPGQYAIERLPVAYDAEDRARRCNQGRLVGGLMGGGAGYALAGRRDRVWATPLGALLGSQIGCNAMQGNAPLPW